MILDTENLHGVVGRAYNMPLADMARAEAFRTLARCLRNPAEVRKKGFKFSTVPMRKRFPIATIPKPLIQIMAMPFIPNMLYIVRAMRAWSG